MALSGATLQDLTPQILTPQAHLQYYTKEREIRGAKLTKDIENLTKLEVVRWLKCRGCRNLTYSQTAENKVSCWSVVLNKLLLHDENVIVRKL